MNLGSIDAGRGRAQNYFGFGDCTAAGKRSPPMSAGLLDGTLEFLLLQHPMPRAAGSPTGRSLFLTASHALKLLIRAIKGKRLDFARARFYRKHNGLHGSERGEGWRRTFVGVEIRPQFSSTSNRFSRPHAVLAN